MIIPLLNRALVIGQPETVLVRVWREDSDQRVGLAITDARRALVDGDAPDADSTDAKTMLRRVTGSASHGPDQEPLKLGSGRTG